MSRYDRGARPGACPRTSPPAAADAQAAGGDRPRRLRKRLELDALPRPGAGALPRASCCCRSAWPPTTASSTGTGSARSTTSSGWTTTGGRSSDPVFRGACAQRDHRRAVARSPAAARARRWRCCSTASCAAGRCCGSVLFAPYVLSEVDHRRHLAADPAARRARSTMPASRRPGRLVQLWLADPDVVLYTLFVVITWKYIGFGIILFLAGLQGIPRELQRGRRASTARAGGRPRGTSRSRCSDRRSGSGSSCRSSARCSCST